MARREKAVLLSLRKERAVSLAENAVETVREAMLVGKNPAGIAKIVNGRMGKTGLEVAIFRRDGSLYCGPRGFLFSPPPAEEMGRGYSYKKNGAFIFFRPLLNEKACWGCHSPASPIRGYVGISIPVLGMEGRIRRTLAGSLLFALFVSAAGGAALAFAAKRMLRGELFRESEEKLKALAEKEFAEAIFNSTASGVAVLDEKGSVIRMNQSGLEILGISAREAAGRRPEAIDAALAEMSSAAPLPYGGKKEKTQPSRETVIQTAGGEMKPVGFTNSQLLDQNGRQKGVIIVFRDLTEIKRLREEISKKQHFEAIGKVIAGVSHEIRNPLFAIQSIGQLLEREITSSQHQALIRAMLKETGRMRALTEELLSYSRPSKLEMRWLDLNTFFEELAGHVRLSGIRPEVIFASSGTVRIKADGDKMRQVFLNLIENAAGASCTKVAITAEYRGGMAAITVRDDGEGIKEDDINKIFEPFFTTKKESTGLGLPICRKIVEEHGGRLDVKSRPGAGTTITVSLPLDV